MKNVLRTALTAVVLTAAAAVGQASQPYNITVPFEFVANGVQLPAGKYKVENDANFVRLTNRQGNSVAMLSYGGVKLKPKGSKMSVVLKQQNGKMHLVAVGDSSVDVMRSVASGS